MAYKFQRGNAILSGALEQEGNITIDGGKLTASAGFRVPLLQFRAQLLFPMRRLWGTSQPFLVQVAFLLLS